MELREFPEKVSIFIFLVYRHKNLGSNRKSKETSIRAEDSIRTKARKFLQNGFVTEPEGMIFSYNL